jgi:hypothetical protein
LGISEASPLIYNNICVLTFLWWKYYSADFCHFGPE